MDCADIHYDMSVKCWDRMLAQLWLHMTGELGQTVVIQESRTNRDGFTMMIAH